MQPDAVIEARDADTIYSVPLEMQREKLDEIALKLLEMPMGKEPSLDRWKEFLNKLRYPKTVVTIGLVGKYVELQDAYKSILEALIHAGAVNECKVEIKNIHSEFLTEENVAKKLTGLQGIIVAPGFGSRGIEGKIDAIRYAREHKIPFFGICLGMQCASIEFARNVLGLSEANSTEMEPDTSDPVIHLMHDQKSIETKGGTMRLGAYDCAIKEGSLAHRIYGSTTIKERHRHRYEFNNDYLERFEAAGMKASGINPETGLVEIIELEGHPHYIASQFHPEYKSTVIAPHPLFVKFVAAVKEEASQ